MNIIVGGVKVERSVLLKYLFLSTGMLLAGVSSTLGSGDNSGDQSRPEYVRDVELEQNIYVREIVQSAPQPKGTVLLLHGFPETSTTWADVMATLSQEYEVRAFDWPGYGRSSRPPFQKFQYSPRDYADILRQYIRKSRIKSEKLVIYATDIGGLPALLAAIDDPHIAKEIIVSDFAPLDRPAFMHDRLQSLKSEPSASEVLSAYRGRSGTDIFKTAILGGSTKSHEMMNLELLEEDVVSHWVRNGLASYEAFYFYYKNFSRDQHYFEHNLRKLKVNVRVIWGEKDVYIKKEMGIELADKLRSPIHIVAGRGHYLHLEDPLSVIEQIRRSVP